MKKLIGKLLKENEKHGFSYVGSSRLLSFGLCAALTSIGLTVHAGTYTWDAGAATNVLNTPANWTTDTAPVLSGDVAVWDGSVTGDLALTWTGTFGAGPGAIGTNIIIAAGQTSGLLIGSGSTSTSTNADNINIGNITIAAGAGALTLGDGVGFDDTVLRNSGTPLINVFTNDSGNTATFASNFYFNSGTGGDRTVAFEGSGNWQVNSGLRFSNGSTTNGRMTVVKNGAGTLTLAGSAISGGTTNFVINSGSVAVTGAGLLGGAADLIGTITNNATLSYGSSASQTISGVISGAGTLNQSAGTLTLTGVNTYSGATTVTGGTLIVGGAGENNSTSGIIINGAGAKYSHTSSVPSNRPITLTNGMLDGTGTVGTVTVADNLGSIVTRGNGGTGALTIGTLNFQGDATVSIAKSDTPAAAEIVVSGTLSTTPANGSVRLNASLPFWSSGVFYNLISAGGFSGSASHFTPGTIGGLTSRQSASVAIQGSDIGLMISGDTPRWTGANNSTWNTSSTGNWQLIIGGTPTTFLNGDLVLFDDNAVNASVSISAGGVSPSLVRFSNSSLNYTVGGPGGITAGSLTKEGTASLTITSPNSYTGGTIINAGTLALSGAGTLGGSTANVTVNGGSLDLGATSQTFGTVSVAGDGSVVNGDLVAALAGTGTSGNATVSAKLTGAGSVAMNGAGGMLTLTAANDYTGGTTVSAGTLALSGVGTLGGATANATVSGGFLDLGGASHSLETLTMSGPGVVQNGSLATSVVGTLTTGTAVVSAHLTGTGSVTQNGVGGILALEGTNTYTGATTVTAGTLQLGNGEDVGSILPTSPITVASGAVFAVKRIVATVQGTDFGVITGAGGFTNSGASTTTLNVPNSYTGTTNLLAGTLEVTSNGALGTGSVNINGFGNRLRLVGGITLPNAINTGGGATVENLSGDNTLTGAFEFANVGNVVTNVSSTAGTLTLGGNLTISTQLNWTTANRVFNFAGAGNTVVNGSIRNSSGTTAMIGVTKNGTGNLTLKGVSDYTERTLANGGVLRVDGALAVNATTGTASEVTVEIEGTLAGTGSIAGKTLVYGKLRPGAGGEAGGRLRFDESLEIDSFNGVAQFDIAGAVFTGVTSTKDAGVTYGGTLKLNFTSGIYNGSYPLFELTGTPGGAFGQATLTTTVDTDLPLAQNGSEWSVVSGGVTYSFNQATGVLTVTGATDAVTPGSTTLSATAGNATADLVWTSASGADTYIVKRSGTSGGPYTVVANGVGGLGYADTLLTNDTTYYYVVEPKNSASGLTGPLSNEVSVTPTAPAHTALQTWRFDQFGVYDDTTGVLAGDAEDFDGDGLANLLEYALGTSATSATVSPVTIARSGNFLTLSYPRRTPADASIIYTVQGGNDLTVAFAPGEGVTDTVGSVSTYTDTVNLSAPGVRRFLRLSVSTQP